MSKDTLKTVASDVEFEAYPADSYDVANVDGVVALVANAGGGSIAVFLRSAARVDQLIGILEEHKRIAFE